MAGRRAVFTAAAGLAGLIGVMGLVGCTDASQEPVEMTTSAATSPSGSSPATSVTPSTTGPTPTATPTDTIPPPYRGSWNTSLADCGRNTGDGKLIVQAREMTFHESVGRVLKVSALADGISVTLQLTGEGETWQDTRTWRLSPDGATLTDVTHGASRSRCP